MEGLEPSLWLSSRAPPAAEHVGWKQTTGTWPVLGSGFRFPVSPLPLS